MYCLQMTRFCRHWAQLSKASRVEVGDEDASKEGGKARHEKVPDGVVIPSADDG